MKYGHDSKNNQIDIFQVIQDKDIEEDIYYNAMGEPLPWEAEKVIKRTP